MRVAGPAARAQRHRRHAEGDRDVGVGRGARELMLVPDGARGGDGGLDERMGSRRESRWPVTYAPDVQRQRRGTGEPVAILLVERRARDGLNRSVELLERAGILAAQVDVEPG